MTRAEQIIDRIRRKHPGESTLGVVASTGKDVEIKGQTIHVIANTADMDLDNEIVLPKGADITYFERNKSVFLDHNYDFPFHVGTLRQLRKYPSETEHVAWRAHIGMLNTQLSQDVLTVARDAGIGASIGFAPLEVREPTDEEIKAHGADLHTIVVRWKWLELSLTAMPCNVACQSMAVFEDDSKLASLDELVTKGRIKRESAVALGLPDRKVHATADTPAAKRRFAWVQGPAVIVKASHSQR